MSAQSQAPFAARRQGGFTLLELMLVIALMGLISALGLAWLGGDSSRLFEARLTQLEQRFQLASALAVHRGEAIGWRFEGSGYRFERLQREGAQLHWVALARQGPGDTADWPAELQLSASPFDNRLGQQLAIGADGARAPQRIWLPNGEILGAALNWRWPQGQRAMPAVLAADAEVAAYGAAYGLQSAALAGAGAVP